MRAALSVLVVALALASTDLADAGGFQPLGVTSELATKAVYTTLQTLNGDTLPKGIVGRMLESMRDMYKCEEWAKLLSVESAEQRQQAGDVNVIVGFRVSMCNMRLGITADLTFDAVANAMTLDGFRTIPDNRMRNRKCLFLQ